MVTICTTECKIKFATNNDYLPEHNSLNNILMYFVCSCDERSKILWTIYQNMNVKPRG